MKANVQSKIKIPCQPAKHFKPLTKIGQGEYGVVFKGCLNSECKRVIAIKQSSNSLRPEHNITNRLKNRGAANVYGLEKCNTKDIMYSEFLDGQSFDKWLVKDKPNAASMKTVLKKLIYILKTLHENEPSFRHNDLHTGNVMIVNGEPRLIDFGLSAINDIPNPEINGADLLTEYGIFRGNHQMYDVHFFLNSLFSNIRRLKPTGGHKSVLEFIERVLTNKYLGASTSHVSNFRLRYNQPHSELPTFDDILKDTYFTGVTPPKKMNAVLKMIITAKKTPASPRKTVAPKSKSPVSTAPKSKTPTKSAKAVALQKAVSILTSQKTVTTTQKKRPTLTRTRVKPLSK
jgi:tRNA A-37 threonylcarbamoyl transferase component Bud32